MQMIKMKDIDSYVEGFGQFEKKAPGSELPWLRQIRQEAIACFAELGFPTTRDEDWRFTNLAPIARTTFHILDNGQKVKPEELKPYIFPGLECSQIVFVNGIYSSDTVSLVHSPDGIKIMSLSEAFETGQGLLEEHLSRYADHKRDALLALNSAFIEDGAFVYIPSNTDLRNPVHILYISTTPDAAAMLHPRNLIVMDHDSQATVIEHYVSLSHGVYFSNAVTEAVVGENSVLSHYLIERESRKAFNVSTLRTQQSRSSIVTSNSILLGGSLVRNNVHPVLAGEGSQCYINGLFMSTGRQHMDNYMKVEHASPHCDSRQLYKGVLNGKSRGVFHGRIIVHKDAQKTDAKQTNRNLLLSDEAQIDTKPQLEIYADDVKCTHGATIGQLDENAIFYLRSRGISLDSARALLLFAFTREILEKVKVEPIRYYLESLVRQWFIQGNLIEEREIQQESPA